MYDRISRSEALGDSNLEVNFALIKMKTHNV